MKKVPVSNEDKKKDYYKYYLQDCLIEPKEKYQQVEAGPSDNALALRIQDRNDLFKPGYLPQEFGWWMLEDGTAVIANCTPYPKVTGEMFDWFFAWVGIDRLIYAIWDNEDHYDDYLTDPTKAKNLNLSHRERCWGTVHNIWEDIGLGETNLLKLAFERPSTMGYDESKIDTEACNALVCANCLVVGGEHFDDIPVVMTHFLRPTKDGSELRSRFWFGWQIENGKAVKAIPDGTSVGKEGPVALLRHNIKEFTNLSHILPTFYAEQKDFLK